MKQTDLIDKAVLLKNRLLGSDDLHPIRVAEILSEINMDEETIITGILHEIPLTSEIKAEIEQTFGNKVTYLLDGTLKISSFTIKCRTQQQADSIRKMIFALIDDIRIIIIKLADKLDRMRNLKGIEAEKQRKHAYEAINIWAPIASRLGISSIKDELEDLSLKFSNPEVFAHIKSIVAQKKGERAEYLAQAENAIKNAAEQNGFEVTVNGRAKHFYSIYQKMRRRNKNADELYDLLAIRILCSNKVQCYTLIGLVHTLWKPIDGRFKDYIAQPKANGYQSLHTTVLYEDKPLEIQIRTYAMHELAEHGIASHWLYKKGTNKDTVEASNIGLVNKMEQFGKSLTSKYSETYIDDNSFFNQIKAELLGESIFTFTPAGDVIELPVGACAIDFAYSVHSAVGEHIVGAKANGQIIQLSTPLANTQTIEIITSQSAHPNLNQLEFVKTPKARAKIRAWLNEHEQTFIHKPEQIIPPSHAKNVPHLERKDEPKISAKIRIGDTSNFLFSFARCCEPKYGDDVIGYVSRGRGIIVHKENCKNIWRIPNIEQRLIQVEWALPEKKDTQNE